MRKYLIIRSSRVPDVAEGKDRCIERWLLYSPFIFLLPLILYASITYCSHLWWSMPLFCASCFYALCTVAEWPRFFSLITWSAFAAGIIFLPCFTVLLAFQSLAPFVGALFLYLYALVCVLGLLGCLLFVGRVIVQPVLKILLWTALFVSWWWFIDTLFFICVGVPCGYCLANPLLCCAATPYGCVLIPVVGIYGLLVLYLLAAGGTVGWFVYRSRISVFLGLLSIGIVISAGFFVAPTQQPEPVVRIVAFKLSGHEQGILETATVLHEQFAACCAGTIETDLSAETNLSALQKKSCPETMPDLIIGPESCLPYALNRAPSLCLPFDNGGACESPLVIFGARRYLSETDKKCANGPLTEKLFNTVYGIRLGRIIFSYDKQFPLPFLETSASVGSSIPFLQGLFFSKGKIPYAAGASTDGFMSQKTVHGEVMVSNDSVNPSFKQEKSFVFKKTDTRVLPPGEFFFRLGVQDYHARFALCSDFFCRDLIPPEKNAGIGQPLFIVLTNDTWFYGTSVADRMLRYAVVWAVRHQTPVLYVGFIHAVWVDSAGRVWPLVIASTMNSFSS